MFDTVITVGLLVAIVAGFAVLRMLDQRSNRQYSETTGKEPPRDSARKMIIRWVIILSIGAGAIYGAYWLYANPKHPITPIGIWILAAMFLILPALRVIRIIRHVMDDLKPQDQPDRKP